MSPSTPIQTRKPGGQPGNANALKHGFYSKSFTKAELKGLEENLNGEFTDEIEVARTNAGRLAELLMDYKNMSIEDVVAASNALNNYLDRIQSLSRAQRYLYRNQTTIEQALEELGKIPPEED
ncbi:MAG: hypothetical protein WCE68_11155 [Anaerolineales bacterium]